MEKICGKISNIHKSIQNPIKTSVEVPLPIQAPVEIPPPGRSPSPRGAIPHLRQFWLTYFLYSFPCFCITTFHSLTISPSPSLEKFNTSRLTSSISKHCSDFWLSHRCMYVCVGIHQKPYCIIGPHVSYISFTCRFLPLFPYNLFVEETRFFAPWSLPQSIFS